MTKYAKTWEILLTFQNIESINMLSLNFLCEPIDMPSTY